MTDQTQLLIKSAIIESRAVHAVQMTGADGVTGYGKTALHHLADGMCDAVSILTGEPLYVVRARVHASAADRKPLREYSPLRAV